MAPPLQGEQKRVRQQDSAKAVAVAFAFAVAVAVAVAAVMMDSLVLPTSLVVHELFVRTFLIFSRVPLFFLCMLQTSYD